jgi:hypothetical protein
MSSYISSQRADRDLVGCWQLLEKERKESARLRKEKADLLAALDRERNEQTDNRSEFDKELDQLQASLERQQRNTCPEVLRTPTTERRSQTAAVASRWPRTATGKTGRRFLPRTVTRGMTPSRAPSSTPRRRSML